MSLLDRRRPGSTAPRIVLCTALVVAFATAGAAPTSRVAPVERWAATECADRLAGVPVAPSWYVAPMAAATLDDAALFLGWPYYQFAPRSDTLTVLDTGAVGFIARRAGAVAGVAQPVQGLRMEDPRLRRVSGDAVDVVFAATIDRATPSERLSGLTLWGGRLDRDGWHDVSRVAQLGKRSVAARQIAGDGASYRDELVAGVLDLNDEFAHSRLVLIRGRSGAWRVEYPLPTLINATYLDLLRFRDTLWIATIAEAVDESAGRIRTGIWLSYQSGAGWAAPRLVREDDMQRIREPRLIGSREGLVVAWRDRDPAGAVLRWRGAGAREKEKPHERRIASFLTRGTESFSNLLSAGEDDTTAAIFELTPDSSFVRARVRTVVSMPALVMGPATAPIAIAPASAGPSGPYPVWLEQFDLRCMLAADGSRR